MPKSTLEYSPEQLSEALAKLDFQSPPDDPKAGNEEVLSQYRNQDVTARNGHDRLTQSIQRIRGTSSYPSAVRTEIKSTLDDTSELDYAQALDQPGPLRAAMFAEQLADTHRDQLQQISLSATALQYPGADFRTETPHPEEEPTQRETTTAALTDFKSRHGEGWNLRHRDMMEASAQQLDVGRNLTYAGVINEDETLLAAGRTMMADAVAHAHLAISSDEAGDRLLHFNNDPTARAAWPGLRSDPADWAVDQIITIEQQANSLLQHSDEHPSPDTDAHLTEYLADKAVTQDLRAMRAETSALLMTLEEREPRQLTWFLHQLNNDQLDPEQGAPAEGMRRSLAESDAPSAYVNYCVAQNSQETVLAVGFVSTRPEDPVTAATDPVDPAKILENLPDPPDGPEGSAAWFQGQMHAGALKYLAGAQAASGTTEPDQAVQTAAVLAVLAGPGAVEACLEDAKQHPDWERFLDGKLTSNLEQNLRYMQAAFPPDTTVIAGRPEVVESIHSTLPFTEAQDYQTVRSLTIQPEVLHGKNVIGNLPMHLESHANSVMTYVTSIPRDLRESRPDGRYTEDEIRQHTARMVEYTVERISETPADFLKEDVLVVTRHRELIDHLLATGLIDATTPVISHIDDMSQVEGKHLIGVASTEMKLLAETVTQMSYDTDTGLYDAPNTYRVRPYMELPVNDNVDQPIKMLAGNYRQYGR